MIDSRVTMSPFFQRKLRAMSTALVILLSLAVAGLLAWRVRRLELAREPARSASSRVLDEVFGAGAAETDDAVLLGDCSNIVRSASTISRTSIKSEG